MASSRTAPPAFVRLLAHPVRWQLVAELAYSDVRVRELVDLTGQPQNLVSYHLRLLRAEGLVAARRSSFDGRDSYYHLRLDHCADALAGAGAALHPALEAALHPALEAAAAARLPDSPRVAVLFACTGNSARSPIAEALLRHHAADRVEVTSAGSRPKPHVHANAVRVLREQHGIDITGQRPRHFDTVADRRFHHVVTLCDKVREVCPGFDGQPRLAHWSVADPAVADDPGRGGYAVFERLAADLDARVRHLLPVLASTSREAQS